MLLAAVMIVKIFVSFLLSALKDFKQWTVIKYQRIQWVVSTWFYHRRQRKYEDLSTLKIGGLFLLVGRDNL